MDALVLHNPAAGPTAARAAVERAVRYWQAHGWSVETATTRAPGEAARLARQAAERRLDAVIVAGGDGTLGQAASGVAGTSTALGLLPVGTANVWARDVRLPLITGRGPAAAERAARALAHARVREVDLGRVGGRHFLLWLGAGLDGHIVSQIEPRGRLARWLGAPFYAVVAVLAAFGWKGARQVVTVDGEGLPGHFLMTLVANTRGYGGGLFRLNPQARLDDGLLEVWVFEGRGAADALSGAWNLLRGRHADDPRVALRQGRVITISSPRPIPVQTDGEPAECEFPLKISVIPRGLRVLVPEAAPPDLFVSGGTPVGP